MKKVDLFSKLNRLETAIKHSEQMSLKALACEQLKESASGHSSMLRAYTDEATKTFERSLDVWGDDPRLLHHLAVSYHAKAWDLELAGLAGADQAWIEAVKYWEKVRASSEFWSLITEKAKKLDDNFDAALIGELRATISDQLLDIHIGFVRHYYDLGQFNRAVSHIRIVRSANLPPVKRRTMNDKLYGAMTAGVNDSLEQGGYESAVEIMQRFLSLVPDHFSAMQRLMQVYDQALERTSSVDDWPKAETILLDGFRLAEAFSLHRDFSGSAGSGSAIGELALTALNKLQQRFMSLSEPDEDSLDGEDDSREEEHLSLISQSIDWWTLAIDRDPGFEAVATKVELAQLLALRQRIKVSQVMSIMHLTNQERLELLDAAESDLMAAIGFDPDNPQLQEQLDVIQTSKAIFG